MAKLTYGKRSVVVNVSADKAKALLRVAGFSAAGEPAKKPSSKTAKKAASTNDE